jgi:4a-hydroxytetrahydrobiopterin dehydratase
MNNLASKHCVPCRGGVPPLTGDALGALAIQLPTWKVINEHHLSKTFLFPDFRQALEFANRIGDVADAEGHHPDLGVSWGKLNVEIFTHKIQGLTESDFVLAAKIEELAANRKA